MSSVAAPRPPETRAVASCRHTASACAVVGKHIHFPLTTWYISASSSIWAGVTLAPLSAQLMKGRSASVHACCFPSTDATKWKSVCGVPPSLGVARMQCAIPSAKKTSTHLLSPPKPPAERRCGPRYRALRCQARRQSLPEHRFRCRLCSRDTSNRWEQSGGGGRGGVRGTLVGQDASRAGEGEYHGSSLAPNQVRIPCGAQSAARGAITAQETAEIMRAGHPSKATS